MYMYDSMRATLQSATREMHIYRSFISPQGRRFEYKPPAAYKTSAINLLKFHKKITFTFKNPGAYNRVVIEGLDGGRVPNSVFNITIGTYSWFGKWNINLIK